VFFGILELEINEDALDSWEIERGNIRNGKAWRDGSFKP
jgi:hypothetical protein